MNRRTFIGLLTAPMIVRATSLDALPRGVPLDPLYRATISLSKGGGLCHITAKRSRVLEVIAYYEKTPGVGWYSYGPTGSA